MGFFTVSFGFFVKVSVRVLQGFGVWVCGFRVLVLILRKQKCGVARRVYEDSAGFLLGFKQGIDRVLGWSLGGMIKMRITVTSVLMSHVACGLRPLRTLQ